MRSSRALQSSPPLAAVKALRDGHHGYTPAIGIPPLREAVVADLARRHGITVDPAQVIAVPGGKVTMFFAIMMFAEEGTEIIYPDPGFPIYGSVVEYSPATGVPLPIREENGFAFSAADLLERITPRTRLIVLNSPANPTGGVTPRAEIEALVEGLQDWPDVAVLSDEIYSEMTYDDLPHTCLLSFEAMRDRVILLEGWSKSYAMTGWRLGYGVWPKELVDAARRLAVNCHSCVNAAAQHAGIAALEGPQDCVREMVSAFDERRSFVAQRSSEIDGISCVLPKGAFYAFPNVTGTGWNERDLATALLEQAGVATIAGTDFGREGAGYIRISCASSLDNIAAAMDRIEAFLAANPPPARA